eukprot:1177597-Prorocentrum_minimum.AAC.6
MFGLPSCEKGTTSLDITYLCHLLPQLLLIPPLDVLCGLLSLFSHLISFCFCLLTVTVGLLQHPPTLGAHSVCVPHPLCTSSCSNHSAFADSQGQITTLFAIVRRQVARRCPVCIQLSFSFVPVTNHMQPGPCRLSVRPWGSEDKTIRTHLVVHRVPTWISLRDLRAFRPRCGTHAGLTTEILLATKTIFKRQMRNVSRDGRWVK